MIISLSNGVNELHRNALKKAINNHNAKLAFSKTTNKVTVIVGTKNIIRNIFKVTFSKNTILLYFTGFGRLYTDFGVFGRLAFKIIVFLSGLRKKREFIVENCDDYRVIAQLSKRSITQINGSGLNKSLYAPLPKKNLKTDGKVIGYMSRFGPSKCTDEIIKLISNLPPQYRVIIAGKDIIGTNYTNQFYRLARNNPQVEMSGFLDTPAEVSSFFSKIDVLLYPSLREGLPITLLESVYHRVPFLTTNVAGCMNISNQFGFPTCSPKIFGDQINHLDIARWGSYSPHWDMILEKYSDEYVQKQLGAIFSETIST